MSVSFRTIQASAVKAVFEVLKDIVNDVNVYFTPAGMRILTFDNARVTLVHMVLNAENFEEYKCSGEVIAGLNMGNVFKLLKSVTSQDTLFVEILGRDFMEIYINNSEKKTSSQLKLKLLDINEDDIVFDPIPMDIITTLSSTDFQRITRDMGNLSNEMTIMRYGQKMELSCIGDFADQMTTLEFPDAPVSRTGGTFSLKYINLFTKATGMCSSVQILQNSSNDGPIIFKYTIANLGDLKFYLAPKIEG